MTRFQQEIILFCVLLSFLFGCFYSAETVPTETAAGNGTQISCQRITNANHPENSGFKGDLGF